MQPRLSRQPRRREQGIALVVVLLFTTIVLTIVVSTTATLAIGARGGGANERTAYQALLASESGLNTFAVRYAEKMKTLASSEQYIGSVEPARMNRWLQAKDLITVSPGSGNTATLAFEGTADNLTLGATGTTPGGATKVVLQNYSVSVPPAMNLHVDSALESHPAVKVTGNATVSGENGASSSGITRVATVNQAGGVTLAAATQPQATVNLSATSKSGSLLLGTGDYAQINGLTYKVTAVQGTQATLTGLTAASSPLIIANNTDVNRLDSAVSQTFTQTINQASTMQVSDPTSFAKDSSVVVGKIRGTVTAVDEQTKTVTVFWKDKIDSSASSPATITEGTPVRKDVLGVSSGSSVNTDGKGTINEGQENHDPRLTNRDPFNSSPDTEATDLFTYTFGQTKAQMLPPSPTAAVTVLPTNFSGTVNGGLKFYDGNLSLSGNQELCGYGILIVRGDLTVNGTCSAGFYGAVYVIGDYDQQGNSNIQGAVIAEGTTSVKDESKIAGTGQGDGKIQYNRAALLDAGTALSPPRLTPVPGTWRQR